ncbi:MAG: autotransporter-associated beta strand repeat-containing protein [Lentisphaeria bacterium]
MKKSEMLRFRVAWLLGAAVLCGPAIRSASAGYSWSTWNGTGNWNTTSSWENGTPPSGTESGALIKIGTVTINDSNTISTNSLLLGWEGDFDPKEVVMTGGSLTVTGTGGDQVLAIGTSESRKSRFTQSGGNVTTNILAYNLSGGYGVSTYTLSGGTLTVGSFVQSQNDAYLVLSGGTLKAGQTNYNWLPQGIQVSVAAGGAIIDTQGYSATIDTTLADGGATEGVYGGLTVNGTGTLRLQRASTYQGGTTVNSGTLIVTNSTGSGTGSGNVTVASGATLGGTGILDPGTGNSVTINGTLAPGASAGTLTIGSSGSTNDVYLNGTYSAEMGDLLAVFGNLTLGTSSALNLVGSYTPGSSYTLASYSTLTGTFATINNLPAGWGITYGDTALTLGAIPEPASLALLFGGLLALSWRKRK